MLPELPSLRQLKDHLTDQALASKCQTLDTSTFLMFTDGNMLDAQNSYGRSSVDARFWISFDAVQNEFKLNVSYFTYDGIGISRDAFAEIVTPPNAAADYTDNRIIRWVAGENNVYNISSPLDTTMSRYFVRKLPTITKIA
jgi:hypothetical protein